MNSSQIRRWIRLGALWAALVAVLDTAAWLGSRMGAGLPVGARSGGDALIFAALALGVSRRNRLAAIALPAYWLATKYALWVRFQKVGALVGALVLGLIFVQAARAVFAAHRRPASDLAPAG